MTDRHALLVMPALVAGIHALRLIGMETVPSPAMRLRYASFFTFQKIGKPVSTPVTYFLKATGR